MGHFCGRIDRFAHFVVQAIFYKKHNFQKHGVETVLVAENARNMVF